MKVDPNLLKDIDFLVNKLSQVPVDELHGLEQTDRKVIKSFVESLVTQKKVVVLDTGLQYRVTSLKPQKQNIFTRLIHWIQNIFLSRIGVNDMKIRLVPQDELRAILKLPHLPGQKTSVRKELLARGYAPIIHEDIKLHEMSESGKMRRLDFRNLVFAKQKMENLTFIDCDFEGSLFDKCEFNNVLLPKDVDYEKVAFEECKVDGKEKNISKLSPHSREFTVDGEE